MGSIAASQITNIARDEKTGTIKADIKAGGFDAGALRDAVIAGIEAQEIPIKERLEVTEKRQEAMAEIQLAFMAHHESLKDLRGSSIVVTENGVFGYTKAVLGTHKSNPTSEYFSVMVDPGIEPQNLDVAILKKADRDGVQAATGAVDQSTTALGVIGTLTFKHIDGTSPDIVFTFDGTEKAADIKGKINAQSAYTGVMATLIPSGSTFVLSLDSKSFSTPVTYIKNITGGDATLIPEPRNTITAATAHADSTVDMGQTGDLIFKHIDGVSADIVINLNGKSANTIVADITAQNALTNVTATVVGNKIVFDALDGKTPPTYTHTIVGDPTLFPTSSTKTISDLQAEMMVQGLKSKHNDNTVKMMGMTFLLFQETQSDPNVPEAASISIEYSPSDAAEKIEAWADTHNALLDIIDKYTTTDIDLLDLTQEEKENLQIALLASNATVKEIERFVTTAVQKKIGGTNTADFGVSVDKGRIIIDAKKMNETLLNDIEKVKNFFGFSETSTDPKFSTSSHPTNIQPELISNNVTVVLSKDGAGVLTATFDYVGSTGPVAAVNIVEGTGYISLEGDPNSNYYKDFKIFYSGTLSNGQSATTTMVFIQGIADQGIGYIDSAIAEDGTFDKQKEAYDDTIKNQQEKINRIQKSGAKTIEALEKKLAAAIEAIQLILSISNQVQTMERMAYASAMGG